jgi:hypothetical protein
MQASLERTIDALRAHGYRVSIPEDRADPAAVATPGPDADPPVPVDGALALEPLETRSRVRRARDAGPEQAPAVDPTRVVDGVAAAAARDLTVVFVVDAAGAAGVREVLTDPPAVRAVDGDGCRTFYDVPDRLSTDDGLACVRADEPPVWREESATGGITGRRTDDGATDGPPRRLVLTADGEVQAAFDDHAALACPAPGAFPYTYRRGDDGRMHVRNRAGREVGVYGTLRGLKADAYRPVPDPLVPETHLPTGLRLRTAWTLAVVGDGVRFAT